MRGRQLSTLAEWIEGERLHEVSQTTGRFHLHFCSIYLFSIFNFILRLSNSKSPSAFDFIIGELREVPYKTATYQTWEICTQTNIMNGIFKCKLWNLVDIKIFNTVYTRIVKKTRRKENHTSQLKAIPVW